jgi:hypothetical protein
MAYPPAARHPRRPRTSALWGTLGLGLGLTLALGAPAVLAQDAPPVNVRFAFSDPAVTGLYVTPQDLAKAESTLSSRIAALFETTVGYWPAKASDGTAYPQLRLRLQRDGSRWFVLVELIPVAGQPPTYAEQAQVYAPGELSAAGGFPPRDRLPDRIEKKLNDFYSSSAARATLQEKLGECAPLGDGAHVMSTENRPVAVLPLRWERYCSLATSVFALEYGLQNGGRVVVIGQGTGEPGLFTPDAPRFAAVMVVPKLWVTGGSEEDIGRHSADFGTLTPRFFRLKKLTTDLSACIDMAGAPPSVAR